MNVTDTTGGNVTEIDSVIIQAFDEDAHVRVYTAINTDGTINTSQLSGEIAIANLNISAQGWTQTCIFSSTGPAAIAWTAGIFKTAKGTSYSIAEGSASSIAARIYIYLDIAVSTTAYQTTTTAADAVGNGKVLIGTAINGATEASFEIFGGSGGTKIPGSSICAATVTGDLIAANTIVAGNMNVAQLSAISADLGTITAGTVTGATLRTAATGTRVVINTSDGFCSYNSSNGLDVQMNGSGIMAQNIFGGTGKSAISLISAAFQIFPYQEVDPGISLDISYDAGIKISGGDYDYPNLILATSNGGGAVSTVSLAAAGATQLVCSVSAVKISAGVSLDLATNSAKFKPKVTTGTVPTIAAGEMCIFNSTGDGHIYLIYYDGSNYHSVQLS
jgi:hypothetical protein